jgi:hypothetical protein
MSSVKLTYSVKMGNAPYISRKFGHFLFLAGQWQSSKTLKNTDCDKKTRHVLILISLKHSAIHSHDIYLWTCTYIDNLKFLILPAEALVCSIQLSAIYSQTPIHRCSMTRFKSCTTSSNWYSELYTHSSDSISRNVLKSITGVVFSRTFIAVGIPSPEATQLAAVPLCHRLHQPLVLGLGVGFGR